MDAINQAALWNGAAGKAWVDMQELLDGTFRPIEEMLAGAVAEGGPRRVLDVGCGTGSTTLAAARATGPQAQCVGIDISAPMLAVARARAEGEGLPVTFIEADAQTHAFTPGEFDIAISRFGVMFFDDPVRAFANLRSACRPQAALRFVCFRAPAENAFMTAAERAARPYLPELPRREPNAPGQFAFADEERLRLILQASGWREIAVRRFDPLCTFAAKHLDGYLTRLGPVGLALSQADENTRTRIVETVRSAFDPYLHGDEIRFTAGCWDVSARA